MHLSTTLVAPLSARSRLVAIALALVFAAASAVVAGPVHASARGDGLRAAANEHRVRGGLAAVVGTDLLDDIARKRAGQMVSSDRMEHDLDYVRRRLDGAGACWSSYGEIIAWETGQETYSYKRTMRMWWDSRVHHDIIMTATFNAAGGAWARGGDGDHYSVMVFATLCASELSDTTLLSASQAYSPKRPMTFRKGTHTGYRLSSDGAVLGTKQVTLSRRSGAEAAGRTRTNGKAYIKVSNGIFAGYWVRESWKSHVRGTTQKRTYGSPKPLSFAKGTYTGYRFDDLGRVTASKTATLGRSSGADARARAIINGRAWFLVENGIWAGYWVRDNAKVNLLR